MHHLTCGISSLLHSANLILFTVLLVHPILRIITSSQSLPSLSPSITPSTFHSRLKTHLFHKCFPPVTLIPSGLHSRILTGTELKGHWCLFVLVSSFYIFFLATCARLSWILSFWVHVKFFNRIVLYVYNRVAVRGDSDTDLQSYMMGSSQFQRQMDCVWLMQILADGSCMVVAGRQLSFVDVGEASR